MAKIESAGYSWHVVQLFGGAGRGAAKRMADRTGIPLATIYSWLRRRHISSHWHTELFAHARRLGVPLRPEDFFDRAVIGIHYDRDRDPDDTGGAGGSRSCRAPDAVAP